MPAKVTWTGLREEFVALGQLPAACRGEAAHITDAAANGAALDVRRAYGEHVATGTMQSRVVVEDTPTGKIVRSASPLAFIFEFGTEARHYITRHGVTHETGAAPAARIFIPAMVRNRRTMFRALIAMIERFGATRVTGVPTGV